LPDWVIGTFTFEKPYWPGVTNRLVRTMMLLMKYWPLLPSRIATVKFPPESQLLVTVSGPAVLGPMSGHRNRAELVPEPDASMLLPWMTVFTTPFWTCTPSQCASAVGFGAWIHESCRRALELIFRPSNVMSCRFTRIAVKFE
jgi:hypothetical protein